MTLSSLLRRRELLLAEQVARKLPVLLTQRQLKPAFSNFYAVHDLNLSLLIAVLDTHQLGDHAAYIRPELLHQLSTDLGGLRVYLSNSTGLRYVILLSIPPRMPRSVELPGDIPTGMVALGMRFNGQPLMKSWSKLGHLIVVGMTGSGKSSLLRSLAVQALQNGIQLALADIDQTTFSMLDGHPNLFAPIAGSAQEALDLILKALGECDHRATLYKSTSGFPETLDEYNALAVKAGRQPLPRILVILDESSAVLKAMGGSSGAMAGKLAELGWRGRKFGIHFVFGAQEFTKDLIGPVREQANLSIAFRVKSTAAQMAKSIGCQGAHRIPEGRPGLAIVDRFGPIQTYYIPKPMLLSASGVGPSNALSVLENQLFHQALQEADGRLSIAHIAEWGVVSLHQARKLQENWALRGWLSKDGSRDNTFCLTEKSRALLSNQQTAQTSSNRREPAQNNNQGEIQ